MRGGGGSWRTGAWRELPEPVGGEHNTEPFIGMPGAEDLSRFGPGGLKFMPQVEASQVPAGRAAESPGPGMAGFTFETAPSQVPGETTEERDKPAKNRETNAGPDRWKEKGPGLR